MLEMSGSSRNTRGREAETRQNGVFMRSMSMVDGPIVVALCAAFLLGIVTGSGSEVFVRDRLR
jgi:hypothetical protein